MSLLGKLTKFGLAKKALDQVRKPENQERIRRMTARICRPDQGKDGRDTCNSDRSLTKPTETVHRRRPHSGGRRRLLPRRAAA